MHPFELIKENQFHARLRCPACLVTQWYAKMPDQKCSCGCAWDNTYLKYAKISVQVKKGEDFVAFVAGPCVSACMYLGQIMQAGPVLFTNVAGFKVEEIFKVEYESMNNEFLTDNFKRLLPRVTVD